MSPLKIALGTRRTSRLIYCFLRWVDDGGFERDGTHGIPIREYSFSVRMATRASLSFSRFRLGTPDARRCACLNVFRAHVVYDRSNTHPCTLLSCNRSAQMMFNVSPAVANETVLSLQQDGFYTPNNNHSNSWYTYTFSRRSTMRRCFCYELQLPHATLPSVQRVVRLKPNAAR